jgi:hypothetical protein
MFLCPGSAAPKQAARVSNNRDFPDPKRNLFYSMFCQVSDTPGMVPKFGRRPDFVIMGDRSPQDDGYELAGNSANHQWGGQNIGQNICYASGQTKWEGTYTVGIDDDSIYECDAGGAITKDTRAGDLADTVLMPVSLGANANP